MKLSLFRSLNYSSLVCVILHKAVYSLNLVDDAQYLNMSISPDFGTIIVNVRRAKLGARAKNTLFHHPDAAVKIHEQTKKAMVCHVG